VTGGGSLFLRGGPPPPELDGSRLSFDDRGTTRQPCGTSSRSPIEFVGVGEPDRHRRDRLSDSLWVRDVGVGKIVTTPDVVIRLIPPFVHVLVGVEPQDAVGGLTVIVAGSPIPGAV